MPREIPAGFCQCGCGRRTQLAKRTEKRFGRVAGQPLHFVRGHGHTKRRTTADVLDAARHRRPSLPCSDARMQNLEKARTIYMAKVRARWASAEAGCAEPTTDRVPPPSCDAAALYREEKARAESRRQARHAALMAECEAAMQRAIALDERRRKGDRPAKHPSKPQNPKLFSLSVHSARSMT